MARCQESLTGLEEVQVILHNRSDKAKRGDEKGSRVVRNQIYLKIHFAGDVVYRRNGSDTHLEGLRWRERNTHRDRETKLGD